MINKNNELMGEFEASPSLGEQIVDQIKKSHKRIWGIIDAIEEPKSEQAHTDEALAAIVGRLVANNLELGLDVISVDRPKELTDLGAEWLEARIKSKVLSELLKQQEEYEVEMLKQLLDGTTITAKSLDGRGFGSASEYSGTTYRPSDPLEVTGSFFRVDPAQSTIWISGENERYHPVHILAPGNPKVQVAAIEVTKSNQV